MSKVSPATAPLPTSPLKVISASAFPELTYYELLAEIDVPDPYRAFPATLAPETCRSLLELNDHNRKFIGRLVLDYAYQLTEKLWVPANGTTISFNRSGKLDDGQHRLMASIRAGLPLSTLVVVGNADDAFASIDKGRKRTDSDTFSAAKEPNAILLAATLRYVYRWEEGKLHIGNLKPPSTLMQALLDDHPGVREAATWTSSPRRAGCRRMARPSMICFLYYVANQFHPDKVEEFFAAVESGVNLPQGHPAIALNHRMIGFARSKQYANPIEILALWIKAWNIFLEGKSVQHLIWRSGGERPEEFPEIR